MNYKFYWDTILTSTISCMTFERENAYNQKVVGGSFHFARWAKSIGHKAFIMCAMFCP